MEVAMSCFGNDKSIGVSDMDGHSNLETHDVDTLEESVEPDHLLWLLTFPSIVMYHSS
jgi:hypothetical protein